jgi:hypothetical protein
MKDLFMASNQIKYFNNLQDLLSTPFQGEVNAMCWDRKLTGDFSEIIDKIDLRENITELTVKTLRNLQLSEQGQLAREILINDFKLLEANGKSPILNVIRNYERDELFPFFPTDVYSFHIDRSTIPSATFLCTYFGSTSEIIPNSKAIQKILIPEIRSELKKLYDGEECGFESFLIDNFFDLHYQVNPYAKPISLGLGQIWKLAIDYPESPVLPCIHRAPLEKNGEPRLLLIC